MNVGSITEVAKGTPIPLVFDNVSCDLIVPYADSFFRYKTNPQAGLLNYSAQNAEAPRSHQPSLLHAVSPHQ